MCYEKLTCQAQKDPRRLQKKMPVKEQERTPGILVFCIQVVSFAAQECSSRSI